MKLIVHCCDWFSACWSLVVLKRQNTEVKTTWSEMDHLAATIMLDTYAPLSIFIFTMAIIFQESIQYWSKCYMCWCKTVAFQKSGDHNKKYASILLGTFQPPSNLGTTVQRASKKYLWWCLRGVPDLPVHNMHLPNFFKPIIFRLPALAGRWFLISCDLSGAQARHFGSNE